MVAVDIDEKPLAVAKALGADYAINGKKQDVAAVVGELAPEGADVVFECTGHPQCIDPAIALCRRFGSFVWQGHYGDNPIALDFPTPHGKRLQMFFSLRRRLAALSPRCNQEHGDGSAQVGTLH